MDRRALVGDDVVDGVVAEFELRRHGGGRGGGGLLVRRGAFVLFWSSVVGGLAGVSYLLQREFEEKLRSSKLGEAGGYGKCKWVTTRLPAAEVGTD